MAHLITLTDSLLAEYRRDYVKWSQSDFGFYVRRHYDLATKTWVTRPGPVRWTEEQCEGFRAILDFDAHDRLPFSEAWAIWGAQTGKSLWNSSLCQFMGMFYETDADIQIISNSKENSRMRVYQALRSSLRMHPLGQEIADIQERMILFRETGDKAMPIPKNAATQAGGAPVLRSIDEIWGWDDESDNVVMGEIKETPARNLSFLVVTSYPGFVDDTGPMNQQLNAMFDENDEPLFGVKQIHPRLPIYEKNGVVVWWDKDVTRKPWVTQAYVDRQAQKATMSPATFTRHFLVKRAPREDAFMPVDAWDACEDLEWEPLGPDDKNVPLVIGIDMGMKADSSAMVARGYDPATMKLPLLAHKIWKPGDFNDVRGVVDAVKQAVLDLHHKQRVLGVFYDPKFFETASYDLKNQGVPMFEVSQNNDRTAADTGYRVLIVNHALRNYPQSQDLRLHVIRAVGVEGGTGSIRLDKRKASQHIDAAVADSQACWGVGQLRVKFERLMRHSGSGFERAVAPVGEAAPSWKELFYNSAMRHR